MILPHSLRSVEYGQLDLRVAKQMLCQAGCADAIPDFLVPGVDSVAKLQTAIDRLCEISLCDGLTGLANARQFNVALQQEVDRVSRSGGISLLLLIDIDNFKRINDTHGHLAGDQALRSVAQVLASNVRPMDTAARNGGDEFALILPNSRPDVGRMIAERIRAQVENKAIELPDGCKVHVTASIGVTHISPWQKLVAEQVLGMADKELYRAKAFGRNCVSMDVAVPIPTSTDEKNLLLGAFAQDHHE